jgi:SAM-dependent methyltransferase
VRMEPSLADSDVLCSFDAAGLDDWYAKLANGVTVYGPWAVFEAAQEAALETGGSVRTVLDLFVLNRAVRIVDLIRAVGQTAVSWLSYSGVLQKVGVHQLRSRYCLLRCFGCYLFIDWPFRTPSGRLVATETYLSESSYECAELAISFDPGQRSLEIGSGSGIVTILLAGRSRHTVAIDIDPIAIRLTRLNTALNGRDAVIIEGDFRNSVSWTAEFDNVIVNPPWRIIPPGVAYPNPTARVGPGRDGLDYVRNVLEILPKMLAPHGKAAVSFDLPIYDTNRDSLRREFDLLELNGCIVDLEFVRDISVERQAEVSSDTCSVLNEGNIDLRQRFLDHYAELHIAKLTHVRCVIRKVAEANRLKRSTAPSCISVTPKY